MILPTILLGVLFLFLRRFYMASARDIKRIEGVAKSPVLSQLSTSLHGLTTIRAFKAQPLLRAEFDQLQDLHSSAWFAFISSTSWFALWLDWIVVVYLAGIVYSFLLLGDNIFSGDVGLAISSCIALTGMLQWGVRQSAEVENMMTSVERVVEYSRLEPEDQATGPCVTPGQTWPDQGEVEFKDVFFTYDKDKKDVLKGVNFKTRPQEKVGIVGRTGAGKSSLVAALFRLAEPRGSIIIDSVDTLQIGLTDLRKQISIIPQVMSAHCLFCHHNLHLQDPLVFTGSLRHNLDPFGEHDDNVLWQLLEDVHLAKTVRDLKGGLETVMSEGGQ